MLVVGEEVVRCLFRATDFKTVVAPGPADANTDLHRRRPFDRCQMRLLLLHREREKRSFQISANTPHVSRTTWVVTTLVAIVYLGEEVSETDDDH